MCVQGGKRSRRFRLRIGKILGQTGTGKRRLFQKRSERPHGAFICYTYSTEGAQGFDLGSGVFSIG
jgi:hypothetical protein